MTTNWVARNYLPKKEEKRRETDKKLIIIVIIIVLQFSVVNIPWSNFSFRIFFVAAGTQSEMRNDSVVYNAEEKKKKKNIQNVLKKEIKFLFRIHWSLSISTLDD